MIKQNYDVVKGDSDMLDNYLKEFSDMSDQILIRQYNRMVKLGFIEFYFQKIYLLALRIEFLKRFDNSPILLEENYIIKLTGEINS